MPDIFSKYIRDIAVFLILQALIGIIAPNTAYKKYIDLLLGLILIGLILSPLNSLINNSNSAFFPFMPEINLNLNRINPHNEYFNNIHNTMILNTYKEDLREQARLLISRESDFVLVDFFVEVNETDEHFGMIESIALTVRPTNTTAPTSSIFRIERVEIKIPGRAETEIIDDSMAANVNKLRNIISSFYNLSAGNIHITVLKNE